MSIFNYAEINLSTIVPFIDINFQSCSPTSTYLRYLQQAVSD